MRLINWYTNNSANGSAMAWKTEPYTALKNLYMSAYGLVNTLGFTEIENVENLYFEGYPIQRLFMCLYEYEDGNVTVEIVIHIGSFFAYYPSFDHMAKQQITRDMFTPEEIAQLESLGL